MFQSLTSCQNYVFFYALFWVPFHTQVMASQCTDLHDLGATFVASSFDWGQVKAFGISIHCLHMKASKK